MHTIDDIICNIKEYDPKADTDKLKKAYEYAKQMHIGQKRISGEDYITHPIEVAYILSELKMDTDSVCGALLHDVIEDTPASYDDVTKLFGKDVADIVDGVTKITKLQYFSNEEEQIESFRKIFIAMANDIRVIIVKLADRLHNMRTLGSMPENKQKSKSQETLDIYAPIAHRLGMSTIKMEFEDLALKYLEPETYSELVKSITLKRSEREEYITKVIAILSDKLTEEKINALIIGRPKHFYSIYKKLNGGRSLSEIYDLIAIRVIVDSVSDCYATLGWVHTMWKPIPGRIKDYIAMPKPNMYQSLHTTVIGPGGMPFEIQIRTKEMNNIAEYGIAAHWKYKEGKQGTDELGDKLHFLMEIKELEKENLLGDEFVTSVKQDLYTDEVFVFTPKGKVIELPRGSTPIDFAYRIHSDIGNKCVGAKVHGKIVPLTYNLVTGDIVEIITSSSSKGPSRDWLNVAVSSNAKSKIRAYLRKANKEENIIKGKITFEHECRHFAVTLKEIANPDHTPFIANRFNTPTWEDLFAVIGYGGLRAGYVIQRIKEHYKNEFPEEEITAQSIASAQAPKPANQSNAVHVQGHSDLAVKFAKCCMPVPGDSIVGYITRGSGITVHRTDCINIIKNDEPYRLIDVGWVDEETKSEQFTANILIRCSDRPKLISDISTLISNEGFNILQLQSRILKDGITHMDIELIVYNTLQLETLIRKLENINSVLSVIRL